jgi:hypothetical protein
MRDAGEERRWRAYFELLVRHRQHDWAGVVVRAPRARAYGPGAAVAYETADALERLGAAPARLAVYER